MLFRSCGFFPIDQETLAFLHTSGRSADRIALIEAYAQAQGMYRDESAAAPIFTDVLELDLAEVSPSLAGPKRPEGRVKLEAVAKEFESVLASEYKKSDGLTKRHPVEGEAYNLGHGDVVIAAITSCTNTSNPGVLIGAGLLARNAVARGLNVKPWVKTSLAPGSQVVGQYLQKSGLQKYLDVLGFNLVGYGCTTCIGNSGPLPAPVSKTINAQDIVAVSVLSGNRNFEGRVNPDVQANYLASPPLVVAFALAGTIAVDLTTQPLGKDTSGQDVYLRDIWPTNAEIEKFIQDNVTRALFRETYANVFAGDQHWRGVAAPSGETYVWDDQSTYVRNPPYFEQIGRAHV